jgi:hypothetical protein
MYLPTFLKGTDSDLLASPGGFLAFFVSLIFIKLIVKIN